MWVARRSAAALMRRPNAWGDCAGPEGAGWAAGAGRIASIIAPLSVPVLLAVAGASVLFTVFGAFFALAAVGTWGLVDRRGAALDER